MESQNSADSAGISPLWAILFKFFGFFLWVVASWVIEFSIVILGAEVRSNGISDSEEVGHVDGVADVGVKVVLEVLKHVHVFLDELISSDSWEREGFII